jgi:hypothetical protein
MFATKAMILAQYHPYAEQQKGNNNGDDGDDDSLH